MLFEKGARKIFFFLSKPKLEFPYIKQRLETMNKISLK